MTAAAGTETVVINDVTYRIGSRQIILTLDDSLTAQEEDAIADYIASFGATISGQLPEIHVVQITLPPSVNIASFLNGMKNLVGVDGVNVNQSLRRMATAPDPSTFSGDYWLNQVRLPEAWDLGTGRDDFIMGLVDSEVVTASGHFNGITVTNAPVTGSTQLPTPDAHGTQMAGLMAAPGNDAFGGAGGSWENRLYVADVGDSNVTTSIIAAGIMQAAESGAKVILVPFGPDADNQEESGGEIELKYREFRHDLLAALIFATGEGCLVVFPAGNENIDGMGLPTVNTAGIGERNMWSDDILIVGATNDGDATGNNPRSQDPQEQDDVKWYNNILDPQFDQIAIFSEGSNTGAMVDIAAPGENVTSTLPDGSLGTASGSSLSAAIVAGIAGLVWARDPSMTPEEVKNLLLDFATPLDVNYLGAGMINAYGSAVEIDTTPTFNSATPRTVFIGETITIRGTFFITSDITVTATTYDGNGYPEVPVTPTFISETEVRFTMPVGAVSGPVRFSTGTLDMTFDVDVRLRITTTPTFLEAYEDIAFSQLIATEGGRPPYTWSAPSGPGVGFPPNYGFDTQTQIISGAADGDKNLFVTVIQVRDSDAPQVVASQTYYIDVEQRLDIDFFTPNVAVTGQLLTITGDLYLPDAQNPPSVSFTIDTEGGPVVLTPTIVNNETLTLTVPINAIDSNVILDVGGTVLDQNGTTPVFLRVLLEQTSATTFPDGQVGIAYAAPQLTARGGAGLATYSWSAAPLPDGLVMNSDGTLTGTPDPDMEGDNVVSVSVSDGTQLVSRNFTLHIDP